MLLEEILDNDNENEEEVLDFILEVEETYEDRLIQARAYMIKFFDSQEMYCGGKIPEHFLLTDEKVALVASTDLESGTKIAYEIIAKDGNYSTEASESLVPEDVKLVLRVFRMCARMRIPKRFIPGIVILYLEFCEGMGC